MEEENRKILQFAQQQQEREAERMAVKQQREDAMSAVQEKVSAFYFKLLFLFAATRVVLLVRLIKHVFRCSKLKQSFHWKFETCLTWFLG